MLTLMKAPTYVPNVATSTSDRSSEYLGVDVTCVGTGTRALRAQRGLQTGH